jgi:hypothetical protein
MDIAPSGERIALLAGNAGSLQVTGSYPVADGVCRTFAARGGGADGSGWRGVACRHDRSWAVEVLVADVAANNGGGFMPASDQATQTIDAFLDAAGAGERLDAAAERQLRESDWQTAPSGGAQ